MKRTLALTAAALTLGLAACGAPAGDQSDAAAAAAEPGSIVEVAASDENLSTLATAVSTTGMEETLSAPGPLTVFAPNNTAFETMPQGLLKKLVTNDKDDLAAILTYHAVEGEVRSPELGTAIGAAGEDGYEITTLHGGTLVATVVDGRFVLTDGQGNTANVVATNVDASNGVVHVIDAVLLP